MKRKLPKFFDRIKLQSNKEHASVFRQQPYQKYVFDASVINLCEQIQCVRKQFTKAAFIGYNPEIFIDKLPTSRYPVL